MDVRQDGRLVNDGEELQRGGERGGVGSARMFDKRVATGRQVEAKLVGWSLEEEAETTSSGYSLTAPASTAVLVCHRRGGGGGGGEVDGWENRQKSEFSFGAPTWLRTKASSSLFHHPLPPFVASHSGPEALCIQTPPLPPPGFRLEWRFTYVNVGSSSGAAGVKGDGHG